MSEAKQFKTTVDGEEVVIETGHLAQQAGGAVTIRTGDTLLLATATMSAHPREGIDFFPLSVDYEERLYAAGRIPGNWFRREGRPQEAAILTARLTDRPLRPLFPKDLHNEVQIIVYSLSHDIEHQVDVLAVNGASAALTISNIPWGGPVGAVRIGLIGDEFIINPTHAQMEDSALDLRMAGTAEAVVMVECGASEVDEATLIEALKIGHEAMQPIIALQEEMRRSVGKPSAEYIPFTVTDGLQQEVSDKVRGHIREILEQYYDRYERNAALEDLREQVVAEYQEQEDEPAPADVRSVITEVLRSEVRRRILEEGVRPDGRDYTTIRPLSAEVGVSPRAHGSGLFQRGETQVLSLVTLGTPRDAKALDGLAPEEDKRYIHHYNFPPFSTGETWFLRGPKRREIGHGALAEAALHPVIPEEDDFPYTIRVVSEVLSSNGSTSMASVCGCTLALMDAGVPITQPVAGIAMGMVKEGDRYAILTDILGMEDHLGDMDFKVAGTRHGITALQMDIKIKGLSYEIMGEALEQACRARSEILDVMEQTISEPRPDLSPYAPRITTIHIGPDKIGAVIGKGGETVRRIQEETETRIDIQEDGTIYIAAVDQAGAQRAQDMIEALTEKPEIGRIYTGRVIRTERYGAFVEILPGTDGMVHISQLADYRIDRVEDVVRVGDEIMVMVTDIDPAGKIRLSRQAVLEGWTVDEARQRDRGGRSEKRSEGRSEGRGRRPPHGSRGRS